MERAPDKVHPITGMKLGRRPKRKNASTLAAWFLVGAYLVLVTAGLVMELNTGSFFSGIGIGPALAELFAISVWVVVGALLVSKQPNHPVGWLWLSIALLVAVDHFTWGYASVGLLSHPGSLPGADVMGVWLYANGRQLGLVPVTLLFLLFPTGRFLSRRWRAAAWVVAAAVVVYIPLAYMSPNPLGYFPFPRDIFSMNDSFREIAGKLAAIPLFVANICAVGAILSLLIRLYRSRGVERQQLKWFVYAAILFIPALVFILLSGNALLPEEDWLFTTGIALALIAITGMAVASAIAIFRYRLYDIDVIINRTLVYSLLTALLVLIYFGSVVLLQQGLRLLTGQDSPIAIVVSTLIIAALFSPLRNRLHSFIDRRFYRRKSMRSRRWNSSLLRSEMRSI